MLTKCWDDENAPAAMMDEHLRGPVLFKLFHFSVIVYNWQAVRPDKWMAIVRTNVRYGRSVETLALKWLAPKSGERYALLLHTLEQSAVDIVKLYDARGGAIESDIQQDKLGLQLLRRRKRSWHAQEA